MLKRLFEFLRSDQGKTLIQLILSGLLGGLTAAEIREPTITRQIVLRLFGDIGHAPDPAAAIGRISIGNVGCTATVIGPIGRNDTQIVALTAAHCIRVEQTGTFRFKDGREWAFTCVYRNPAADCAWLIGNKVIIMRFVLLPYIIFKHLNTLAFFYRPLNQPTYPVLNICNYFIFTTLKRHTRTCSVCMRYGFTTTMVNNFRRLQLGIGRIKKVCYFSRRNKISCHKDIWFIHFATDTNIMPVNFTRKLGFAQI